MAVTQLLLTGVPAFVGSVVGQTKVRFSIDENDFDPNRLIEIDLAKNPQKVQPAAWAQDVDCDHQTAGGLTTIGPTFHAGPHCGAVYLSDRLVTQHAALLANWPPAPDARFQYQLLLRNNNGQTARYHGFKAQVVNPVGSLARVAFFRTGAAAPFAVPEWIDLSDPDVCDAASNGFTTITAASPIGTIGAVFLNSRITIRDVPQNPKIPKNLAW
jgi:hypothetical protein